MRPTKTGQTASRPDSLPPEQEPSYGAPTEQKPATTVQPYQGERHVGPDGTPLTDPQERCLERVRRYNNTLRGQWDEYRDYGYYMSGPKIGQKLPIPPPLVDERTCAF